MSDQEESLKLFERLKNERNLQGDSLLNFESSQNVQISFLIDNQLKPASFRPHQFLVNTWYCHEQTLRSLRPHIFADYILHQLYEDPAYHQCHKCREQYEPLFYKNCPYCLTKQDDDILRL